MLYEDYQGSRLELLKFLVEQGEEPAFLARYRTARDAISQLYHQCAQHRENALRVPRRKLAELAHALNGDWSKLQTRLKNGSEYRQFSDLHQAWSPEPCNSGLSLFTSWRRSLGAFVDSVDRFNRAWADFLQRVDIESVNQKLADYNHYYPIEKVCAFGSEDIDRLGFQPIAMMTRDRLEEDFPPLRVPELAD